MYEIGWLRMLSLVLGSTTHSFELMLSAFITGLAFGGLWIKRRIDRIDDAVRFSGWVQVLMGVAAVLTLPLYVQSFDWMAAILRGLKQNDFGYAMFTGLSHGITLCIMVPTTFLAGTTLPLFTHVLMRRREGERAIGRIYAANTLGAIAGVLVAVHVLMPLLGPQASHRYRRGARRRARRRAARAQRRVSLAGAARTGRTRRRAALVVVMAGVQLDPRRLVSGVYRYRSAELDPDDDRALLPGRQDGQHQRHVARQPTSRSRPTANQTRASKWIRRAPRCSTRSRWSWPARCPLVYKPDARRVANIGLGSGLTTHTLLGDPSIERVDTVEIEAAMTVAAHGFGERVARTFNDPRSTIHLEDAKTFFSQQKQPYDVDRRRAVESVGQRRIEPVLGGVLSLDRQLPDRRRRARSMAAALRVQRRPRAVGAEGLTRHFSDYAIYNTDNVNILIVAKRSGRLPEPTFDRLFGGPLAASSRAWA